MLYKYMLSPSFPISALFLLSIHSCSHVFFFVRRLERRQNLVASDGASPDVGLLYDGLEASLAETGRYQSGESVGGPEVLDILSQLSRPFFLTEDSLNNGINYGVFTRISKRFALNNVGGECRRCGSLLLIGQEPKVAKKDATNFSVAYLIERLAGDSADPLCQRLSRGDAIALTEKLPCP